METSFSVPQVSQDLTSKLETLTRRYLSEKDKTAKRGIYASIMALRVQLSNNKLSQQSVAVAILESFYNNPVFN